MTFTDLLQQTSSWIPLGILGLSAVGSSHCIAMCGPLNIAINRNLRDNLVYHIARLFSYMLLASLVFAFKQQLQALPYWQNLSAYSELLLLLSLLFLAVGILWQGFFRSRKAKAKANSSQIFVRIGNFLNRRALLKPQWIGFLNGFIPCGWLYSFLLVVSLAPNYASSLLWTFSFWLPNFLVLVLLQRGFRLSQNFFGRGIYQGLAVFLIVFVGFRFSKIDLQALHGQKSAVSQSAPESCH